jgi:hypothetical protein
MSELFFNICNDIQHLAIGKSCANFTAATYSNSKIANTVVWVSIIDMHDILNLHFNRFS